MSGEILILLYLFLCSSLSQALECVNEPTPIDDSCFDPNELIKFAEIAMSLEKSSSEQLNLLDGAEFVLDDVELGADLFVGFKLSEELQKLQLYGNAIITFLDIAVHYLSRNYGISREQALHCFSLLNLTADALGICERYDEVQCDAKNSLFQPIDGICSSMPTKNPYIGAKNTPFGRLFSKNSYKDSIHKVRDMNELPSARLISSGQRTLHIKRIYSSRENLNNDMLVFYMKLVMFDLIKTLKEQSSDGNFGFDCCSLKTTKFVTDHCMPIDIPEKDQRYRNTRCLNYIRAMVTHDNCRIKEASILNTVTHFMDMDFIYDPENIRKAIENGGTFPDTEDRVRHLILIGDERVAMLPQLYAIVLVWIRFHNEIAERLKAAHPSISSEAIFYETRRLLIAVYQSIWTREVLPLVLSETSIRSHQLDDSKACFDETVDPVISAEFASVVARYFHKFIHENYTIKTSDGSEKVLTLRDLYRNVINPHAEWESIVDAMLTSPYNTDEIAGYLYANAENPGGIDLRALDLQAERDFGVGSYKDFLHHINATKGKCIKKFSDLRKFVSEENLSFLKYAYNDPHDVDFSVGAGMHATAETAAVFNEIFENIFANQFHRLKCGDPYFYTNALSEEQIAIIEEIYFSDVLCIVGTPSMMVQSFAFITPGVNNSLQSCGNIVLNLDKWKLLLPAQDEGNF